MILWIKKVDQITKTHKRHKLKVVQKCMPKCRMNLSKSFILHKKKYIYIYISQKQKYVLSNN